MIRVLFVCLGNICRSTMAEAVFRHGVREAGLEAHFVIDSAGTADWNVGSPPHRGTQRLLHRIGIRDYTHSARQLRPEDLRRFDYILTMDDQNLADALSLSPKGSARIMPLLAFAPQLGVSEVPDPYYDGRYEEVYVLIRAGCAGLLQALQQEALQGEGDRISVINALGDV